MQSVRNSRHALWLFCVAAFGCAGTGTATGELKSAAGKNEAAVSLEWKSMLFDPLHGEVSGTLPGGRHFSGQYFEVVKTAPVDVYGPAWLGWEPFWPDWAVPWHTGDLELREWPAFAEIYTGRVIANLHSDDNQQHLRCRFQITHPFDGLQGGGRGHCQLSDGESVEGVVLAPGRG